jgi:type IV secretory pathway VirB10-like protein
MLLKFRLILSWGKLAWLLYAISEKQPIGGITMRKLVAILVSIMFVLSVTGLCFAADEKAAPAKDAAVKADDKAVKADDKAADKKVEKKKAPKKAKKAAKKEKKEVKKEAPAEEAAPAAADKK